VKIFQRGREREGLCQNEAWRREQGLEGGSGGILAGGSREEEYKEKSKKKRREEKNSTTIEARRTLPRRVEERKKEPELALASMKKKRVKIFGIGTEATGQTPPQPREVISEERELGHAREQKKTEGPSREKTEGASPRKGRPYLFPSENHKGKGKDRLCRRRPNHQLADESVKKGTRKRRARRPHLGKKKPREVKKRGKAIERRAKWFKKTIMEDVKKRRGVPKKNSARKKKEKKPS